MANQSRQLIQTVRSSRTQKAKQMALPRTLLLQQQKQRLLPPLPLPLLLMAVAPLALLRQQTAPAPLG
jgi:hypothetical protein